MTVRVLAIDDHPLFRKGLAELLQQAADMTLVAQAANGAEGLALAQSCAPDLVVLDLNMADISGLQVLQGLRGQGLKAPVVMLTMSNDGADLHACMSAGASGYLLKDMQPDAMLAELRRAAAGDLVLSAELRNLLAEAQRQADQQQRSDAIKASLTAREWDILGGVAQGLSNKLIGRQLDISDGTVKVHLRNIGAKLELSSRLELAVWYMAQRP